MGRAKCGPLDFHSGTFIAYNGLIEQVDMDKLADGLQKLGEDDLLQVVQMVHDNKSADSYTKNDVERMYFLFVQPSDGSFSSEVFNLPSFQSLGCLFVQTFRWTHRTNMVIQRANSTSTSTRSQMLLSRCCGTLHKRRALYDGMMAFESHPTDDDQDM